MPQQEQGTDGPKDPMELRAQPRVATDFPVRLYSHDFSGPLHGRTRDLGLHGACLATASPFAIKSLYRIELILPTVLVEVSARGCWQREQPGDDLIFTGIAFGGLSPSQNEAIWRILIGAGQQLARFLYENSTLWELGLEEAMGLSQVTRYRSIPAGRTLYRQDTRNPGEDSIFLLMEGQVGLQVRVRDALELDVGRLGPGDLFGGFPLVVDLPHIESAIAETDTSLLEIDSAAFRYVRSAKPWLGQRLTSAVIRVSAERVRAIVERATR